MDQSDAGSASIFSVEMFVAGTVSLSHSVSDTLPKSFRFGDQSQEGKEARSLTKSLTKSLTNSLTQSLTHSLTQSLATHSETHALAPPPHRLAVSPSHERDA
eukprot:8169703-Pyramimonas_sp.AAC.1